MPPPEHATPPSRRRSSSTRPVVVVEDGRRRRPDRRRRHRRHPRRGHAATRRSSPPSSSARPCSSCAGRARAILAARRIGHLGVALAFGFALLILAYVIGPISGCHINPAITLGMLLAKKITPRHAAYAVGRPGARRDLRRGRDLRHRQRPRRLGAGHLRRRTAGTATASAGWARRSSSRSCSPRCSCSSC